MAKVIILKDNCKGCGLCINFCPKHVLIIGKDINALGYNNVAVDKMEDCISCKTCTVVCPEAAIELYK